MEPTWLLQIKQVWYRTYEAVLNRQVVRVEFLFWASIWLEFKFTLKQTFLSITTMVSVKTGMNYFSLFSQQWFFYRPYYIQGFHRSFILALFSKSVFRKWTLIYDWPLITLDATNVRLGRHVLFYLSSLRSRGKKIENDSSWFAKTAICQNDFIACSRNHLLISKKV